MKRFEYMLEALLKGEDIVDDNVLNSFAVEVLDGRVDMSLPENQEDLNTLLTICNILYNNSDRSILPVEDGVYDKLMVLAVNVIPNFVVGAPPTDIKVTAKKQLISPFIRETELISPFIKVDESKIENGLFTEDLIASPTHVREQFYRRPFICMDNVSKKMLSIPHEYPKLVGTLDKVKFVLNSQADEHGVLNDENVAIFERDFLRKHVEMGILDPNRTFTMLATLKMDGVSVEGTVSDRLISARSRGDTTNDVASDLTPALRGYKFPKAVGRVTDKDAFGMKFECLISNANLQVLGDLRGVSYANPRNAIIGLLGAGDCNQWLEYITLVPLETSLDIDPISEIVFMNELYADEPLRYAVIQGTYEEVLFQVKKFAEEAEFLRPVMPFMYDGVVLTYVDEDIRKALGRVNFVNKYSIAIKFNPLKKQTRFLGYTYSVGQNGVVTPKAHYNPIELLGATHTKTTVHSLKRFNELNLREGDIVTIELVNDVIPYISKPDIYENECNPNPIIPFPEVCPCCGTPLVTSKSAKVAICPNIDCPERRLSIVTNMLDKLGFKDFSEETLKKVNSIHSLYDLITVTEKDLVGLGPVEITNFLNRVQELLDSNMYDYRLVGALGFTNISQERWSKILKEIKLEDIIYLSDDELRFRLKSIKGIGSVMVDTIILERQMLMQDLITIYERIPHKVSFGSGSSTQIRFTGIRDKALVDYLQSLGYDCTEGGVTSKTNILIVPYLPYTSSKIKKASEDCILVPLDEFKNNMDKYLKM